jgi:short-subunit dehydrogenase
LANNTSHIVTDYVVADFNLAITDGFFLEIFEELQNKGIASNLSILVNNVEIYNTGYLHEITDEKLINEVIINCIPCVLMTNYAIPYLLKRDKRSAIINISSIASRYAVPYFTNYSATKSYIDTFSQALSL